MPAIQDNAILVCSPANPCGLDNANGTYTSGNDMVQLPPQPPPGYDINRLGTDQVAEDFANLMPWGTPDQVLEKLSAIRAITDMDTLMCQFSFGGMPYDVSEKSVRLFAAEVMPVLKQWRAEERATEAAAQR